MTPYKCLIVDDEPIAQRILEGYLQDLKEFQLEAKCLNALVAREILETKEINLMFLDLEMPKLKGFAFLKTLAHPPAVIITTAYREYAIEGYELEVVDYLLKPITFERFLKAVNRFKKLRQDLDMTTNQLVAEEAFLYAKSDRKTLKIKQSEIIFIEGMNNYIKVNCATQTHTIYASLNNILKKLSPHFVRVHKSYIVNKNKIMAFTQEQIELPGKTIPVGHTYRDQLKEI